MHDKCTLLLLTVQGKLNNQFREPNIIIMYIYHALINALSAHMIHINLNMIFYAHVEQSPAKTIYIKYHKNKNAPQTHTHTEGRVHHMHITDFCPINISTTQSATITPCSPCNNGSFTYRLLPQYVQSTTTACTDSANTTFTHKQRTTIPQNL